MSFGALAPAHAAVARPQEQGEVARAEARLVSGDIDLDIAGPRAATVSATFRLAGDGEIVVLLANLPGQRLEELEMRVNGANVAFVQERRSSAMRSIRAAAVMERAGGAGLAAAGRLVQISYRVRSAATARYRFALPVPEATPGGEERSVRLTVQLPDGAAFAGNSFPPLRAAAEGEWTAATLAVPAQAHVVFGDAGLQLWGDQLLQGSALGVATVLLLAGWVWSRRRVGRARDGGP